jgi:hypothetical protein
MIDNDLKRKAEDYRFIANRTSSEDELKWASLCADLIEEQLALLEKTGRCPEIPYPPRPCADHQDSRSSRRLV